MTSVNRRRFMRLAGGTAAASMMSAGIARAAQIPANRRTGSIKDVEHVVVLMQENRSFDHYFGTMRGVRGFGDPRPVTLPSGKPVWYQSDGAKEVTPFHPDAANLGLAFLQDLDHGWDSGHRALNGGAYDQWIPAKASATTMAHLERGDIPFHHALADAFTVCDSYHCSLLGPTDPNRYYMWTGWVGNDGRGGGPVINNAEAGYDWTTYPERLEAAGVSWKIYQDIGDGLDAAGGWGWIEDAYRGNYGDNSLLYFDNYRDAKPGEPLYDKARTGTDAAAGDGFFDVLKADVLGGTLPSVSWIVAPEAFTEHPNWPANYGAWYISQVLDALTADPEVWSRTALFITYDENDGFFDHVVPPTAPVTPAQGASTADVSREIWRATAADPEVTGPYGLGQRVPMTVVSPWSTGGWVCSETFDHTSIIRFVEKRFGVHEPNITPWRRAICGDLTSAFDFSRRSTALPPLPGTGGYLPPDHDRHGDYVPTPPAAPRVPRQEPGTRPARPVGYDLSADASVNAGRGLLSLEFAAHGPLGAGFHVRSSTHDAGPWSYTVGSGRELSGSWDLAGGPSGGYAFTVHGPAGFFRELNGTLADAGPEVRALHDGHSGLVRLTLANSGPRTVRLTVRDGYGHEAPAVVTLRPGAWLTRSADPRRSGGWYDLTVTADGDPAFLRRLAGHVETGAPSVSDPALGGR